MIASDVGAQRETNTVVLDKLIVLEYSLRRSSILY